MKKGIIKTLAMTCASALLLQMAPVRALETQARETEPNLPFSIIDLENGAAGSKDPFAEADILTEDPDKRSADSKYFLMSDGSFLAVQYPIPVHYQDEDGAWQEYDNSMKEVPANENTEAAMEEPDEEDSVPAEPSSTGDASSSKAPETESSAVESEPSANTAALAPLEDTGEAPSSNTSEPGAADASSAPAENGQVETDSAPAADEAARASSQEDASEYANKKSDQQIRLAKKAKANKMFTIKGEHPLSWGYLNANKSRLELTEQQEATDKNGKFLQLNQVVQEGWYRNLFSGVDLQVLVSSTGLKENLILSGKDSVRSFEVAYKTDGLTPVQVDAHTIVLNDRSGDPVYTLLAPVMTDAQGNVSNAVYLTLTESKNKKFSIRISAEDGWLEAAGRVYPVTVDPLILTDKKEAAVDNATIVTKLPANTYPYGSLYVGNVYSYGETQSVVQATMPALGPGDMVIGAQLWMVQVDYSGNTDVQVNASKITSSWKRSDYTNKANPTRPSRESVIADYVIGNASTNITTTSGTLKDSEITKWDITRIVKDWYKDPSSNHGIYLWQNNSGNAAYVRYVANNIGSSYPSCYPRFFVQYVNNNGLEDYWSYHSQDVGVKGAAYINDYTGNLVITEDLFSSSGSRMPNNIQLVYNSRNYNKEFPNSELGVGFQFNFNQRVDDVSSTLKQYGYKYKYTDADGTEHYFRQKQGSSTVWVDEDGLNLELTEADGGIYIRDKDGNELHFSTPYYGGALFHAKDSSGNRLRYYATNRLITSIEDGAGRVTTIEYGDVTSASGAKYKHPLSITGPDGYKITFGYNDNNKNLLNRITYPDGSYTDYWYDGNDRVAKIRSSKDRRVHFDYAGGRVVKTTEYDSNFGSNTGDSLSISYNNDNTTTFTDHLGRKEVYQFDNAGRTVSIRHDDGSVSNADYEDNKKSTTGATSSPEAQKNNKLNAANGSDKYVRNYIKNPSAENGDGFYNSIWDDSGKVGLSRDSTVAYLGQKSLKAANTQAGMTFQGHAQQLFMPDLPSDRNLTLSCYVKTDKVTATSSGGGAGMYFNFYKKDGTFISQTTQPNRATGTNDWQRISFSTTAPAGTYEVRVYFGLRDATGTVWFDCMQLETGESMSDCNLLEDSSFNATDIWKAKNFNSKDSYTGNGNIRVTGEASANKYFYQIVPVNKKGVCFNLFGTLSGYSVPDNTGRLFALELDICYADGKHEWQNHLFNSATSSTQSISFVVRPKRDVAVEHVGFYFISRNQANTATLQNVMMTFDETGATYSYDSDGNLQSAKDNAERNQTYTYNNSDKLTQTANPKGETYKYFYESDIKSGGNKHRVAAARSNQLGNGFTYTYDSYGNVVESKAGTVDTGGKLDSSKPYLSGSTAYNSTGNYAVSQTDARGNTAAYDVNETNGLVRSLTSPVTVYQNGKAADTTATLSYTYDSDNYNLLSLSGTGSAGAVANTYAYNDAKGLLTAINHNGFSYTFGYDSWDRRTTTSAGGQVLATNTYLRSGRSSPISKMTYGNGDWVSYSYDKYDRPLTSVYDSGYSVKTFYNAKGQVSRSQYRQSTTRPLEITTYSYDLLGRMVSSQQSGGYTHRSTYKYDNMDNLIQQFIYMDSETWLLGNQYTYGKDNLLTKVSQGAVTHEFTYDSLNRVTQEKLGNAGTTDKITVDYAYTPGANGSTTTLVSSLTFKRNGVQFDKWEYAYDKAGNISQVKRNGKLAATYYYDALGQLVMEKDAAAGVTNEFTYDQGGNLTQKKQTPSSGGSAVTARYTYGNSKWKDLLTAYNGQAITYDAIGNPLTYRDGMTLSWERGRQLSSLQTGGKLVNYEYDSDRQRTKKVVAGAETKFYWDDRGVMTQQDMPDGKSLWFYSNPDGSIGSLNYEYVRYTLVKDLQGNVIGLADKNGSLAAKYTYDAWGNILSVTDGQGNDVSGNPGHIANVNPLRYRGYYFDQETGFYYLHTRYYDPKVGRFINADGYIHAFNLSGMNLFSYCINNPVSFTDSTGQWFGWDDILTGPVDELIVGLFGLIVGLIAITTEAQWAQELSSAIGNLFSLENILAICSAVTPYYAKQSKQDGKTRSTDKPSWVNKDMIDHNFSAHENAKKILDNKYGKGNWKNGPNSEYNKIVKWLTRSSILRALSVPDGIDPSGYFWYDTTYTTKLQLMYTVRTQTYFIEEGVFWEQSMCTG